MTTLRGRLVLLLLAVAASPAAAAPDPAQVTAAVERGAAYLKARPVVAPAAPGVGDHAAGRAALIGLAMLEAGVKPDDPAVAAVTDTVRRLGPDLTQTYDLSLAVLYLDRLGDAADVPLLQLCGVRLYAGMQSTGGFAYECPLVGKPAAATQLRGTKGDPPAKADKPKPDDGFLPAPAKKAKTPAAPDAGKLAPAVAPVYLAARAQLRAAGRGAQGGDNSNTQFGLIGLWVAARHGLPADDAMALLERRFIATQNRADGGWAYQTEGQSTTAMTCAGLLGIAVGASRKPPPAAAPAKLPAGVDPDDPFFTPPTKKAGPPPPAAPRLRATAAGLTHVGRVLKAVPGVPLKSFVGLGDEYYTLWSVERVAMAYGLDTIGDVDWFSLGAGFLLPAQEASGAWPAGHSGADVSTAFAVLFLLRSNFVADLTAKIKGKVKDPGKAELRAGKDFRPAPRPDDPAPPGPGEAAVAPVPAGPDADQLATELVSAADFPDRLRYLRDEKGAAYTAAIVRAVPRLIGEKQGQARDALAARLTRMTAKTLAAQLTDPDPELRRAAARAAGLKLDKATVGPLIGQVTDGVDEVAQAARTSLTALTGQDFGPQPGADAGTKDRAKQQWSKWFLANGG